MLRHSLISGAPPPKKDPGSAPESLDSALQYSEVNIWLKVLFGLYIKSTVCVYGFKKEAAGIVYCYTVFSAHGGPGGYNAGGGGGDATDGYNDDGSGGGGGGGHFSGGGGGGAANSCGSCCDGGIGGTASNSVSLFLSDTMQPRQGQTKALHFELFIITY